MSDMETDHMTSPDQYRTRWPDTVNATGIAAGVTELYQARLRPGAPPLARRLGHAEGLLLAVVREAHQGESSPFEHRSVAETHPQQAAEVWDMMDADGDTSYEPDESLLLPREHRTVAQRFEDYRTYPAPAGYFEDDIEHADNCQCGEHAPWPAPTPDADLPGGSYSADL